MQTATSEERRNALGQGLSDADDPRDGDYMALLKQAYADPRHEPFHAERGLGAALLVHGFPGTPAEMRPLATALAQTGWTVDVPLLPGFGRDIDTLFDRDDEDWLSAIRAAYEALAAVHAPVLLIGHSMGGAIAMRVAADVEADGLILLAPFWRLPLHPVLRWLSPILRLVIRRTRPFRAIDFDMEEVQTGIHEFLPDLSIEDEEIQQRIRDLTVPTRLFVQLDELGQKAWRAAADFGGPTLIVQGTHDELVTPQNTRKLMLRLDGPVEYVELPAHHDLVDETKDAWHCVKKRTVAFAARMTKT